MRKLRLALIFVVAVMLVLTAVSCGKKKPTEPEGGEAVLADETVVLDETEAESIIEVTDDQIVLPVGTNPSIYQKGNVIMSGVTDVAPYGLLRKVESSSTQNGQIVVNTSQATLVDAFDQLDFHTTQSLKTTDIVSSEALIDGVRFIQDSKNPYNYPYTIDVELDVGNNVTMYIDGELNLTLGYELDVDISLLRGLHHIKAGSFVTSNGDLELNVDGAFNYKKPIELCQHIFAPVTFWIPGPVPGLVILVPKVIIVLDVDAYGEAHVTATVSASASVEAGLEYQKPNWSSYCEKDFDFGYDIPVVDASMNATVSAGPRFEINLFGVTGPWAHARGFLNLDADINANPWWTLTGGYVVDAGVHFEIFGYEESATIPNIINHSVVLAQASPNQVVPPTFNPPGGIYTSAQNVTISCVTPGVTIRYTTNGTEPTTNSPTYSSPINVASTTTIKAKGFKGGWTPSSTASATYTINAVPPGQMILVPGGTFTMGDTRGQGDSSELPTHTVTLNSFYIGKYEVTQAEYSQYMPNPGWTSSRGLGDNYPAYYLSWYAILKYCNLRSMAEGLTPCYSISGSTNPANWGAVPNSNNSAWNAVICNWNANGYRLPTEAEWEYAARGATNNPDYLYSGSDDINAVAWYTNNSGGSSHPVGTRAPNGIGTYDMSGNAWEWCWDWYSGSYYSSSPQHNPRGPESGSKRVLHGGSWDYYRATECRVSNRSANYPSVSHTYNGFRLCRSAN